MLKRNALQLEVFKHTFVEQVAEAVRADEQYVQRDDLYNKRLFDQPSASRRDRL